MINVVFEEDHDRAAAYDGDKFIGESTFSRATKLWIIDHTEVNSEYGGQGIGSRLVETIVEKARLEGIKIVPMCPFAKREFMNKPEYADVWSKF